MVSSNDASKQNTGERTSSAKVGDWERFGGLGFLHISARGLIDLDLSHPRLYGAVFVIGWGQVGHILESPSFLHQLIPFPNPPV